MNIIYQIKNVYGKEVFYPVNENARTICELMGQKTFTEANFKTMERNSEFTFQRVLS